MLLKQKKVNCHKCGVNFIWQANQFNQQKSVKRFQENTITSQEHTLRRKTTVSSFILRSAAAVCSSASEQTVALPTNNRPSPLPFVATRRVSSDPPHRAREIGDRWPLQDWSIGPCYCPFWAERLLICLPRTLNCGRDAEIQIRSDGCPVGEKAS